LAENKQSNTRRTGARYTRITGSDQLVLKEFREMNAFDYHWKLRSGAI